MRLCDECGAKLVNEGKIPPLSKVWGANNIPFSYGACKKCGKVENLMEYPDYLIQNNGENK
ncbi:hypothetical protein D4R86_03025 [bacterium]|nr:MAG: hypothetical protein D4R86_03025 [bacterium]